MRGCSIKETVVKDGEKWYIKKGDTLRYASDLLISVDSICMTNVDYMVSEGEEIEIVIKVKNK